VGLGSEKQVPERVKGSEEDSLPRGKTVDNERFKKTESRAREGGGRGKAWEEGNDYVKKRAESTREGEKWDKKRQRENDTRAKRPKLKGWKS